VTSRRLISAESVKQAEATIAAAVAKAVDEQRATVSAATRASRSLTAAGPSVWSNAAWAKTVHKVVAPVATAVGASMLAEAKQSLGAVASWAAPLTAVALSGIVVAKVLDAGVRLASVLSDAAGNGVGAVGDALDSAAGWVGDLAGRMANAMANQITSELATHASSQSATVYTMTWQTQSDDRVRPDHDDADGQTVAAGETFTVGGEELLFPGDENGSEANTINCRCYLTCSAGGDTGEASDALNEDASPFGE
jgi:hypothetical protein